MLRFHGRVATTLDGVRLQGMIHQTARPDLRQPWLVGQPTSAQGCPSRSLDRQRFFNALEGWAELHCEPGQVGATALRSGCRDHIMPGTARTS